MIAYWECERAEIPLSLRNIPISTSNTLSHPNIYAHKYPHTRAISYGYQYTIAISFYER